MKRRFVTIWFPYLLTDWLVTRRPQLAAAAFVLAAPDHGRLLITAINPVAEKMGIETGMVVADAKAIHPSLLIIHDKPGLANDLLTHFATGCIRYTPIVSIDPPAGLVFDASGCAHLWGGEKEYLAAIRLRFHQKGYTIHIAIADTIGAAWALTRYASSQTILPPGQQSTALLSLPPAALRLQEELLQQLYKLGLRRIRDVISIPRPSLRRRFGTSILLRIDQALGAVEEFIEPVIPPLPNQERMPCPELIHTRAGVDIALQTLLKKMCDALKKKEEGLRSAIFKAYRVDGRIESIRIGTHRPTANPTHLYRLFEAKLDGLAPGEGIELFLLDAPVVERFEPGTVALCENTNEVDPASLSELLDRLEGRIGANRIHRYLPAAHYWPERSIQASPTLLPSVLPEWTLDRPRPLHLLSPPEPIEVTAPVPDYPPMLFRHRGRLHKIVKADGPERIEQEWWLQQGDHRDYYTVEDEAGQRYWLFRSGHYTSDQAKQWFLHGYFA